MEKRYCIGPDHGTELESTAETDKEKTYVLPDENIITVAPSVSVSRKCCSSHAVPIHDGYALHHAIFRLAGRDPTEDMMKTIVERECSFTATAEKEIVRHVSQKLCYIGLGYDTEHKSPAQVDKEKNYEPQTEIITVGAERFHCAEVFFQPSFTGKEAADSTTLLSSTS